VCEVEPFPCAVLAHHYPDVPNLGDVTADDFLERAAALRPDVLVGGPPCQDFSVAGLRAGIHGDRGNLTLRWVQIIHATQPAFAVTENVPGWLSANDGHAFGAFLAGLVGADTAIVPPRKCGGRWTNAGMVDGPAGRAAWRILDAQYFGLAQRRKRVFVVFCAGNRADPAEVLFEREGVCRDHPPGRQARQDIAGTIGSRATGGGGLGADFDLDGGLICGTLQGGGSPRGHGTSGVNNQAVAAGHIVPVAFQSSQSGVRSADTHATLDANNGSRRHTGAIVGSAVRRLTLVECEKLQGFPAGYTNVAYRGKPAADGNRYKALGNSFAVPVVRWIGERISSVEAGSV
jgi:DNA (cytosine-5)-methyltransferase 1